MIMVSKNIYKFTLKFSLKSETAGLLVFCEVGLESKLLATSGAAEWLDVAVCLHVSPQVALVSEALAALVTAEGFLPGVSPDVSLQ